MKRKTFLLAASTVTLAAISVPVIKYFNKGSKYYDPLMIPDELSRFCEEKTIRHIGKKYRLAVPEEKDKANLKRILLTADDGKLMATNDKYALAEFIDSKVQKDFLGNTTVIVDGWIISKTEARQCALFSLT